MCSWRTVIGVAVQRGTKLRRVAATVPQLIEQVQVNVTVQRRDRRALRHPDGRCHNLSLVLDPDFERLLDQLQYSELTP